MNPDKMIDTGVGLFGATAAVVLGLVGVPAFLVLLVLALSLYLIVR